MTRILKTKKRLAREAKYARMYAEYCELVANANNDKMAILDYLTKKHSVSQSCFYNYLRAKKKQS